MYLKLLNILLLYFQTKQISSVGGKSIKIMVKRIMSLLFTQKFLCDYSYNGRGNKKHNFSKLLICKTIFGEYDY